MRVRRTEYSVWLKVSCAICMPKGYDIPLLRGLLQEPAAGTTARGSQATKNKKPSLDSKRQEPRRKARMEFWDVSSKAQVGASGQSLPGAWLPLSSGPFIGETALLQSLLSWDGVGHVEVPSDYGVPTCNCAYVCVPNSSPWSLVYL